MIKKRKSSSLDLSFLNPEEPAVVEQPSQFKRLGEIVSAPKFNTTQADMTRPATERRSGIENKLANVLVSPITAAYEGIKGGIEDIAEVAQRAPNMAVIPTGTLPNLPTGNLIESLLGTAAGAGKIVFGAANVIPGMAGFTAGMKGLEEFAPPVAEVAGKVMTPIQSILQPESYGGQKAAELGDIALTLGLLHKAGTKAKQLRATESQLPFPEAPEGFVPKPTPIVVPADPRAILERNQSKAKAEEIFAKVENKVQENLKQGRPVNSRRIANLLQQVPEEFKGQAEEVFKTALEREQLTRREQILKQRQEVKDATQKGNIPESGKQQYTETPQGRQTPEASGSNRPIESGKIQKEKISKESRDKALEYLKTKTGTGNVMGSLTGSMQNYIEKAPDIYDAIKTVGKYEYENKMRPKFDEWSKDVSRRLSRYAKLSLEDLKTLWDETSKEAKTKLVHFAESTEPKIVTDPKRYGQSPFTQRDVKASKVKGTFMYLDKGQQEPMLRGRAQYEAEIPASKIYDLNEDPKGYANKAKGNVAESMEKMAIKDGYEAVKYNFGQGQIVKKYTPTEMTRVIESSKIQEARDLKYQQAKETISRIGKESLKQGLGSTGGNLSPYFKDAEFLKAVATLAKYHIENGATKMGDYLTRMKQELGDQDFRRLYPVLKKTFNTIERERVKGLEKASKLPKGEMTGEFKNSLESMNPEVRATYEPLYDTPENLKKFDQLRGGKISDAAFKKQAIDYASRLRDEDILESKIQSDPIPVAGAYLYSQKRFQDFNNELKNLNPNSTPEQVNQAHQNIAKGVNLLLKSGAKFSDAGRILRAKNIFADEATFQAIRDSQEALKGINPELAESIGKMIDDVARNPKLMDKFSFWYFNSLLSSPFTDMANVVGNTGNAAWEIGTLMLSNPKYIPEIAKGVRRGLALSKREISDVYHQRASTDSKFLESIRKYDIKAKTEAGKMAKTLLPTTRLNMEDAAFRGLMRGVKENLELAKAEKALGKSKQEITKMYEDLSNGALDNIPEANLKYMEDIVNNVENYVDYVTFRSELGKVGKSLQGLSSTLPGKLIIPFIKTPINILKVGIDNSPLGLRKFFETNGYKIKLKDLSSMERQDILRRVVAGSAVWGTLGGMVNSGKLEVTGSLPKDKYERELMLKMGYKPNHIYVKNSDGTLDGISYQNINPFNVILGIVGNAMDKTRFQKELKGEDLSTLDKIDKIIYGNAQTFLDQSFMSGLSQFMDNVSKGESIKDASEKYLVGLTPNVLSFPKQLREYATGEKPSYRTSNIEDMLKNKMGMTEGLQPIIDLGGDVSQKSYERFPFFPSTVKSDKLLNYLKNNNLDISLPSQNAKIGKEKMTPEQYTKYAQSVGKGVIQELNRYLPRLEKMDTERAQDLIDKIVNKQKKLAKNKLRSMK